MIRRVFRASLHAIALRWVLAALLLLAQQGALTHALSHAGGHTHEAVAALHTDGHAAADAASTHKDAGGRMVSGQCAYDLVYTQVLGGIHAGHNLCTSAGDAIVPFVAVAQSFSATPRIPYDSRGPPAFS